MLSGNAQGSPKKNSLEGGGHLEIAPSKKKIFFKGKPVYALTSQQFVKNQTECPKNASWGWLQGCRLNNLNNNNNNNNNDGSAGSEQF